MVKLLARNGAAVVVAAISPYRQIHDEARGVIGRFVEVYVNCPIEECMRRGDKGLYKKALKGKIHDFNRNADKNAALRNYRTTMDQKIIEVLYRYNRVPTLTQMLSR